MASKKHHPSDAPVLVIGLGRFGGATAMSLMRLGHQVLAADEDGELVQKWSTDLTHTVELDSTDEEALRQVGAEQFDRAIVGIGTDVEASVLTVLSLVELGVSEVWAKAVNPKHGKILKRVGANHVVYPERAMGERVAHMVSGQMIDYMEFDDGFAIARTRTPEEAFDKTLSDSALRSRYGVTVVGIKRPAQDFTYAQADTMIHRRDELIVSGPTHKVERFCALTVTK